MAPISEQEFEMLLARAGVGLTLAECARLKTIYGNLESALSRLHAVNVDDDEVAGEFSLGWLSE
ncbi:hypothetical protein FIM12_05405 [SAR202 cluster bacterium AD-804-J14_MRT_500m]|nr:hypothetical protein [SAR202 cluster bacterium AD-804-J14_MRT_500m]